MIVAIGCDHGGFVLKPAVKEFFEGKAEVLDFGTATETPVDYPDIAFTTARAVSDGKAEMGVLMCGTGIGMSVAANKVKGVRAAACNDVGSARMGRAHNNLNVLCLGGRVISPDQARPILDTWCSTPFEGERHLVRVNKIAAIESSTFSTPGPGGEEGRVVVSTTPWCSTRSAWSATKTRA
jgi:ribose 5-phosphate isomerase B